MKVKFLGANFNIIKVRLQGELKAHIREKVTTTWFENPDIRILGWKSRFSKNSTKAVLFLDYDKTDFNSVKKDCEYLQDKYDLGTMFIVQANKKATSFHVYCFDVLDWKQIKIITVDSECDEKFEIGWRYVDFCSPLLRLGLKDENESFDIVGILTKGSKNPISIKHLELFFDYFEPQIMIEKEIFSAVTQLLNLQENYVNKRAKYLLLKYNTYSRRWEKINDFGKCEN